MTVEDNASGKRRILVCYDGSPESERALDRAAELASAVPSEVTVVSVAEPLYRNPPYTGHADPAEETAHHRLLEQATAKLSGRGFAVRTLESVARPAPLPGQRAETAKIDATWVQHEDKVEIALPRELQGELALSVLDL